MCVLTAACALMSASLQAQNVPTDVLNNIDIEQKLGAQMPLDVPFRDSKGRTVTFGELLDDRPAVLCFVYYGCPMLCTETLNGILKAANAMALKVGEDYDIITVSFDHEETTELAASKRTGYVNQCRKGRPDKKWHFLTGDASSIEAATKAAGFKFRYIPETGEFAHASAAMVLTPQGVLSKYFYGIEFSARDLRLGLVDAADRKIGSAVDKILLWCYHYDPATGKYGVSIMRAVRAGGVVTVATMLSFILVMVRRDRFSRKKD